MSPDVPTTRPVGPGVARPLVAHLYTADPSAHVFDGTLYVYPSHDVDAGVPQDDSGEHFAMEDYHVLSMPGPDGPVTDHGPVLHVRDVPWADRQMWAPDAARDGDRYVLYFPAKTPEGLFRIGAAVGPSPVGPFTAEPEPIAGAYSIDPAVLADDDGAHYLYFGGIWGGQLQKYRDDVFDEAHEEPAPDEPALGPRVARLGPDLVSLAEPSREVVLLDEDGVPLRAGDTERRFFEGAWVHRHAGRYHLSWSTGDTHLICYGTSDSPYGPFTYAGQVLTPVTGWTTQHSIVEHEGRWLLFFHDASQSGGRTHLRTVKVTELEHDDQGRIRTVTPS
jgi:hypothetical protein